MTSSYEAWTWSHVPFGNLAQVRVYEKLGKITETHSKAHGKAFKTIVGFTKFTSGAWWMQVQGACGWRFQPWAGLAFQCSGESGPPNRQMHAPRHWVPKKLTWYGWIAVAGIVNEGGTGVKVFSNHAIHVISLAGAHDRRGDVSYCQVGPPVYVRNRRCQLEFFRPRELSPIPLAVLHQIPLTSHALSCSAPEETYLKRLDQFLMKLGPGGWQNLWQFHGTSCNEIDQDISGYFNILYAEM